MMMKLRPIFQYNLLLGLLMIVLTACGLGEAPTPIPTMTFSAPTLAPSPTVSFRSSGELDSSGGANDPTAAALPRDAALPPIVLATAAPGLAQRVEVVMRDGSFLEGTLYQASDIRVPGVLLVSYSDEEEWGDFPRRLRSAGFTVLVIRLRETSGVDDMADLLATLSEIGSVDPSRLAVIGSARGADTALVGCAVDQRCDAVALLSPLTRGTLLNLMAEYNPRPLFTTASASDPEAYDTAEALISASRGASRFIPYDNAGRGAQMLAFADGLTDELINWLVENVAGG